MASTPVQSSRIMACMARLFDLLDEQTYTPHPTGGKSPKVWFGGDDAVESQLEAIIVVGSPDTRAQTDFASMSLVTLDEQFTLRVVVTTQVPTLARQGDRADRRTFNRLAELIAAVETPFRDPVNGRPAGGFGRTDAYGCGALWWRVGAVNPEIYPFDGGIAGYCELDIVFNTRL